MKIGAEDVWLKIRKKNINKAWDLLDIYHASLSHVDLKRSPARTPQTIFQQPAMAVLVSPMQNITKYDFERLVEL